jgi:hypothetical protein
MNFNIKSNNKKKIDDKKMFCVEKDLKTLKKNDIMLNNEHLKIINQKKLKMTI